MACAKSERVHDQNNAQATGARLSGEPHAQPLPQQLRRKDAAHDGVQVRDGRGLANGQDAEGSPKAEKRRGEGARTDSEEPPAARLAEQVDWRSSTAHAYGARQGHDPLCQEARLHQLQHRHVAEQLDRGVLLMDGWAVAL